MKADIIIQTNGDVGVRLYPETEAERLIVRRMEELAVERMFVEREGYYANAEPKCLQIRLRQKES